MITRCRSEEYTVASAAVPVISRTRPVTLLDSPGDPKFVVAGPTLAKRFGPRGVVRAPAVDAREVDEAALGIGVQELEPHAVADVETFGVTLDPALDRRCRSSRAEKW